jgi:hypothetical protein
VLEKYSLNETSEKFYQTTRSNISTNLHPVTLLRNYMLSLFYQNTRCHSHQTTRSQSSTKLHTVTPTKLHAVTPTKLHSHSHQTTRSQSCCMQHCALPYTTTLYYTVNSEATSRCPPYSFAQRSAALSDSTLMHRMILCNG